MLQHAARALASRSRGALRGAIALVPPGGRRARANSGAATPGVDRSKWLVRVGLELHAQVKADQKLFSHAKAQYGAEPNTQVNPFDAALPGTLPALNRQCAVAAARTGLALGGEVQHTSCFDRKHYYYADLPHGFQITQHQQPLVLGGALEFEVAPASSDPYRCKVNLEQIQLEVDTGKSTHATPDSAYTLVDLNRAGSALMEIVTQPDMGTGAEAAAFVKELQLLLRHIGTSDGNMEEGSLRVDVNVSVTQRRSSSVQGGRCEVKNLNSLRNVARAVEAEAARHISLLERGESVERETRGFDVETGRTFRLRSKETALDYRFLPEPDLPALLFTDSEIQELRASLQETPNAKVMRLMDTYRISKQVTTTLVSSPGLANYFEDMMRSEAGKAIEGKRAANWVVSELTGAIRDARVPIERLPPSASPSRMAELLEKVQAGKISFDMAKSALSCIIGGDARRLEDIVQETFGSSELLSDDEGLRVLCEGVLKEHSEEVALYKSGKNKRLMSLFVGKVMKATGGRADAKKVSQLMAELMGTTL